MSTYQKILSALSSGLLLALVLAACEPFTQAADEGAGAFDPAIVESVRVQPAPSGKASDGRLLLTITLRPDANASALPDGFSLNGSGVILRDDGAAADGTGGDRVYSALVPAELVPVAAGKLASGQLEEGVKCKIEFAPAGEELCGRICEGKSIIFRQEVVVCFCITECEISLFGSGDD